MIIMFGLVILCFVMSIIFLFTSNKKAKEVDSMSKMLFKNIKIVINKEYLHYKVRNLL